MRKKWNSRGFTLVETLCAVAILTLLSLMLGAGMQAAMTAYRNLTAKSETQLLLNTLVNAIADELRYTQPPEADGEPPDGGHHLTLDANGQVLADGVPLLPTGTDGRGGAYHGGTYRAEDLDIQYDPDTACFTLKLNVVWTGGAIRAETPEDGVAIRRLNPPKEAEPEGGTP